MGTDFKRREVDFVTSFRLLIQPCENVWLPTHRVFHYTDKSICSQFNLSRIPVIFFGGGTPVKYSSDGSV